MLITITSCQQLVFILSPRFLLILVDALHIFFGPQGGIHARMSFLLFPITQDLFFPNFLARIRS